MALSPRQQRFVEEYVACGNAAEAYRRAGYTTASARVASAASARLLARVSIQEAINVLRQQSRQALQITREDILRGFHEEATNHTEGDSSPAARVAARKELAKLLGFYPAEEFKHRFPDATLDALLAAEMGRLSLGGPSSGRD